MRSFLLISIIFAAVAIPAIAARDPSPLRGMKRALLFVLLFDVAYVAYVALVHPVLFLPHWP